MKSFLCLRNLKPAAVGRQRYVFVHPDDPDLVVKVVTPDFIRKRSKQGDYYGRWHKNFVRMHLNFVRARHYIGYLREIREHLVLHTQGELPPQIQTVTGLVETDIGLGMVSRTVRGRDGNLAPSLLTLLEQNRLDENVRQHLDEFCAWLVESPVVICDLNPGNLVYGYQPELGDYFVLIDGIGEKNFIPLASMSAQLNRLSKLRRIRRLNTRLDAAERERRSGMLPRRTGVPGKEVATQ